MGSEDRASERGRGRGEETDLVPTDDHAWFVAVHVEYDLVRICLAEYPVVRLSSVRESEREEWDVPVLEGEVEEGIR